MIPVKAELPSDGKTPTLVELSKPSPYIGKLSEHPFVSVIESGLEHMGVHAPSSIHADYPEHRGWSFSTDEKVVVRVDLKLNNEQEVCIELSAFIGEISKDPASAYKLMQNLLWRNCHLPFPLSLAVQETGVVEVVFNCNSQWLTEDHLLARLYSIGDFASSVCEELLVAGLIQPLHPSFFKIYRL
jgi:hypothetical protein